MRTTGWSGGDVFPGREHPRELGFALFRGADDPQHELGFLLDDGDQLAGFFLAGVHLFRQVEGEPHQVRQQGGGDLARR